MEQNQKAMNPSSPAAAPSTPSKAPRKPKLQTINGETLMGMEFEPLQFTAEKILPHGLFLLAGSPKIGKSWLALDLCRAVSTGGELWDFTASTGDVLYFALVSEDVSGPVDVLLLCA